MVINNDNETTIEGIQVDLGRKESMLDTKQVNKECCPICALDLKPTYTVRITLDLAV